MSEPSTSTWTVTSQTESDQVVPTGGIAAGVEIAFMTGEGHSGTVWVPKAKYTVDKVRAAVAAAAQQMDVIGSLSSGTA